MKKLFYIFTAALMALFSISCEQEIEDPNFIAPENQVTVNFTGEAVQYEMDDAETKSEFIASSSDGDINTLQIIVYQNGSYVGSTFSESNSLSLDFVLNADLTYNMYAIANLDEISEEYIESSLNTEEKLKSNSSTLFKIESLSSLKDAGIPMSGTLLDVCPTDEMSFAMKRLLACYRIKLNKSERPEHIESSVVDKIAIHNVNKSVYLFQNNSYAAGSDDLLEDFDYTSEDDIAILNGDKDVTDEVVFYMLENMQTTGAGVTSDATSWDVVKDFEEGDELSNCTYLEFTMTQKSGPQSVSRTYVLFLGGDFKNNFDIKRNVRKTVTLKEPVMIRKGPGDVKQASFSWGEDLPYAEPGKTFEWDFTFKDFDDIVIDDFSSSNPSISVVSVTLDDQSGTVLFSCADDAVIGDTSDIIFDAIDSYGNQFKTSTTVVIDGLMKLITDPEIINGANGTSHSVTVYAVYPSGNVDVTDQCTVSVPTNYGIVSWNESTKKIQLGGNGTIIVTFSFDGKSVDLSCTARSTQLISYEINPTELILGVGQTGSILYSYELDNGAILKDRTLSGTIENTSIATISSGVITGVSAGETELVASIVGTEIRVPIIVTDIKSIKANPSEVVFYRPGESLPVTIDIEYENGTKETGVVADSYSIPGRGASLPPVATVASGIVYPVSIGETMLTITHQGKTVDVPVSVKACEALTVEPAYMNMYIGDSQNVSVRATYADGNSLSNVAAKYEIDNTSVATVSSSGCVNALTAGSATLKITHHGKTVSLPIVVTPKLTSISFSNVYAVMYPGQTAVPVVNALYNDNSTVNCTSLSTITITNLTSGSSWKYTGGDLSFATEGSYRIEATYEGKTISQDIKVCHYVMSAGLITKSVNGLKYYNFAITWTNGNVESVSFDWEIIGSIDTKDHLTDGKNVGLTGSCSSIYQSGGYYLEVVDIKTTFKYPSVSGTNEYFSQKACYIYHSSPNVDW